MTRSLDTTTDFGNPTKLPTTRRIERPDVDELAKTDPPTEKIKREPYLMTPELRDAVGLAIMLGRPLLLQGDPGCGKTQLARAVAFELGLPLESAYIKSTTRAQDLLYTYDAVQRLFEASLPAGLRSADEARAALAPHKYIRLGPFGRAIRRAELGRRSVVLIDEIDKADLDFPNDLLRETEELRFTINETGETHAAPDDPTLRPIIFVTHNEEKPLPPAFLRRCIYHELKFPDDDIFLAKVLTAHRIKRTELSKRAIAGLLRLRKLDLTRQPGISELLDWVRVLDAHNTDPAKLVEIPAGEALLKSRMDLDLARRSEVEVAKTSR